MVLFEVYKYRKVPVKGIANEWILGAFMDHFTAQMVINNDIQKHGGLDYRFGYGIRGKKL